MAIQVLPTEIADVVILEPQVFGDDRGFFMETYHREKFTDLGLDFTFVQDNLSRSKKNVLRGLHYQLLTPQGKVRHGDPRGRSSTSPWTSGAGRRRSGNGSARFCPRKTKDR